MGVFHLFPAQSPKKGSLKQDAPRRQGPSQAFVPGHPNPFVQNKKKHAEGLGGNPEQMHCTNLRPQSEPLDLELPQMLLAPGQISLPPAPAPWPWVRSLPSWLDLRHKKRVPQTMSAALPKHAATEIWWFTAVPFVAASRQISSRIALLYCNLLRMVQLS